MSSQVVNTNNLDRFLAAESERLKMCTSDEGFFQRLATISIPKLKELKGVGEIIYIWENEMSDSQLIRDAFNNLISFLQWHWDIARKLNLRLLRNLVWNIVRKIRGSVIYVNWGRPLPECINPILEEILSIDVGEEKNERPSLDSFQQMQKLNILKTYQANQDCDPKYLWQSLRLVSSCWERRHERALSRKWNKPKGSFFQIILQAYNQTNEFLHDIVAEELRLLDKGKVLRFFKREKFQSLFDRFVTEFRLEIIHQNVDRHKKKDSMLKLLKKQKLVKSTTRIPRDGSDEQNFCDWYKIWKKETSQRPLYERNQKMATKAFLKQTRIRLSKKYEDSTFLRWITAYNKRNKTKK